MHRAVKSSSPETVEWLLEQKANINETDVNGQTSFLIACRQGETRIAEILLDKHADIRAADLNGSTPLLVACRESRMDIAELLVKQGVDVEAADEGGLTPIQAAYIARRFDIVELLKDGGAEDTTGAKFGTNSVESVKERKGPYEAEAARWRALMPASKWWGRGGIPKTLRRYADPENRNEISVEDFAWALRNGLLMGSSLQVDDVKRFTDQKPWSEPPKIIISKFMQKFINVYFEYERCLYDVLLVQNRWQDLRAAFRACNSVLVGDPEKNDMQISRVQGLESDKMSGEEHGKQLADLERPLSAA